MTATLVKKSSVFAAKIEGTIGTAESLTSAEAAYNVYDLEIVPDIPIDERQAQGHFGTQSGVPGGQKGKATFKHDLRFNGLAVPTWADLLFPACGLVKTGAIFKPKTQTPDASGASVKTLTIAKYMGGKKSFIYGAMGTFKITWTTSKIPVIEFEFEGVLGDELDATMLVPTYPTDNKLKAAGAPVTFDSVPLCLESFSFDLANTLYVKECPGQTKGYEYTVITDRKPRVTANPESRLVAVQNRMSMFRNGTEAELAYSVPAPSLGFVNFVAPLAQIGDLKEGDRSGVSTDDKSFILNSSIAGDDDFSIEFLID
jgi:hypothetical protein